VENCFDRFREIYIDRSFHIKKEDKFIYGEAFNALCKQVSLPVNFVANAGTYHWRMS